MTVADTSWLATLTGVGVAIVLSIIASATRRWWIALPAVLAVAASITLTALQVATPASPLFVPVLVLAFVVLATVGGSPLVAFVLATAITDAEAGAHGGMVVPDDNDNDGDEPKRKTRKHKNHEVLRGGTTIGYLERFATIGSVLVGQPAAIAIVVAIKGLGRFSELDSPAVRERFIIGTLVSLAWAGTCTAAVTLAW